MLPKILKMLQSFSVLLIPSVNYNHQDNFLPKDQGCLNSMPPLAAKSMVFQPLPDLGNQLSQEHVTSHSGVLSQETGSGFRLRSWRSPLLDWQSQHL